MVRRCKGNSLASGGGRRYKGFAFAAWFRVLLQHAGAVHPCTARTKSPCSDVLRGGDVLRFDGHCLRAAGAGIDEATDIQLAKDAAVRGSGASRPWMACARLLEPGTAESGDAHDPRTAAAPPEARGLRRFSRGGLQWGGAIVIIPLLLRGGAVWQLVGLITRRSQVQILPPLPCFLR